MSELVNAPLVSHFDGQCKVHYRFTAVNIWKILWGTTVSIISGWTMLRLILKSGRIIFQRSIFFTSGQTSFFKRPNYFTCVQAGKTNTIAQHSKIAIDQSTPRWSIGVLNLLICCALADTAIAQRRDEFAPRRQLLDSTQTYTSPGTAAFVVPVAVTSITVTLTGASGANSVYNVNGYTGYGGLGGKIIANIPVTPGETLQINVGGQGGVPAGGSNGGGTGGGFAAHPGGGGGGASDIRRSPYSLNNRLAVAGGGAGGYGGWAANGGNGGYPAGGSGSRGLGDSSNFPPTGGTASAGGTTTNVNQVHCFTSGTFGAGAPNCSPYGGGGGGGWWGGGFSHATGGGGGSSYIASGVTLVSHGTAPAAAHGSVTLIHIDYNPTALPTPIPSPQPTSQPSRQPSSQPTQQPTTQPTRQPSTQPSIQPSTQPTCQPSSQLTQQPTTQPTRQPSTQPSIQPSTQPTCQPSSQPTQQPATQPTRQPSTQPSIQPSTQHTCQPSSQPTRQPYSRPSGQPTIQPSRQPTGKPSRQPSTQPTRQPTTQPTHKPCAQPSGQPTVQPVGQPTAQPVGQPSSRPSSQPSIQPSWQPTSQPSSQPSIQPTMQPLARPTLQPTNKPTLQPSTRPSRQPSVQPSVCPTGTPTSQPSVQPTNTPSVVPSSRPTAQPSISPSVQPSVQPSSNPTSIPSVVPSGKPSLVPSAQPSSKPSSQPTTQPSTQPSSKPSTQPTNTPSAQPSMQPVTPPSSQPSRIPSAQPTRQPTSQPINVPTSQPSATPTALPTLFLTGREYLYIVSLTGVSRIESGAYIYGTDWSCGNTNSGKSLCIATDAPGKLRLQISWDHGHVTSMVETAYPSHIYMTRSVGKENSIASEVAKCQVGASDLTCSGIVIPGVHIVSGSYAIAVKKVIFIGTNNLVASICVFGEQLDTIITYRYASNNMDRITLLYVHSPPNFIGSFVAGTCTTTGGMTHIWAGIVRTDSGDISAMYVTPANGVVVNSAELVNAMALEYTQPNSFIGGGLQYAGAATGMQAYLLCVNTIYQTVTFARLFQVHVPVNVNGRRMSESKTLYSAVKGLAVIDNVNYVLISWNTTTEGIMHKRATILKTDLSTGNILQQVHIESPTGSIYCNHMHARETHLTIACSVVYNVTGEARALLLSVDKNLTCAFLPTGFVRYTSDTFYSEVADFHAKKLPVRAIKTASETVDHSEVTVQDSRTVSPTTSGTRPPFTPPSCVPSAQPSSSPTAAPSVSPQPTSHPSSSGPTNTYKPTVKPTLSPTLVPTTTPTQSPTVLPTNKPNVRPTTQPSRHPTTQPSVAPTIKPTRAPQNKPTRKPTCAPSFATTQDTSTLNSTANDITSKIRRPGPVLSLATMIVLYVLAGLTAVWCFRRMLLYYAQTQDNINTKKIIHAHMEEINCVMAAEQYNDGRASADTERRKKSVLSLANRETQQHEALHTPFREFAFVGAYCEGMSSHSVHSPDSASVVLSSLHSSEMMSDVSYSVYTRSEESALEEGCFVSEEVSRSSAFSIGSSGDV